MKVLVCGGRNFYDWRRLEAILDLYRDGPEKTKPTLIIHGAASGADSLAGQWATYNGIKVETYPAEWKVHGRAAGGIRNQLMLDQGKPELVIAFPGGNGTADMVNRAKAAGAGIVVADYR